MLYGPDGKKIPKLVVRRLIGFLEQYEVYETLDEDDDDAGYFADAIGHQWVDVEDDDDE